MHTHNTKSQEEMICEDFLFHFTTLKQEKVIKKWNTLFLLPWMKYGRKIWYTAHTAHTAPREREVHNSMCRASPIGK